MGPLSGKGDLEEEDGEVGARRAVVQRQPQRAQAAGKQSRQRCRVAFRGEAQTRVEGGVGESGRGEIT